jgi:uncharacterized membrane protein
MSPRTSGALRNLGRIFYGLPMAAFGALSFVLGDLTTRFARGWPEGLPGRAAVAYLLGIFLVAAGLAIVFRKRTRIVALALAAAIALSLVFLQLPKALAKPRFGGSWTNPTKYLSLLGGALLVARLFREDASPRYAAAESPGAFGEAGHLTFVPRLLLSTFLVLGGVQHFVYESFVVTLIPDWIPNHVFWARFAGAALLCGGVGLWVPPTARLAGELTGLMIFLWFLIVHIPRAAAAPGDPLEWSGVFESLATSGIALMLAGSTPGRSDPRSPTLNA